MHFALETDYAVRMISVLSEKSADKPVSLGAAAISEEACVPKPTALKVLRLLKDNGIIRSTIGKSGGYRLARHPSEITLLEVLEAMEGKLQLSRCLSEDYDCSRTGTEHECCRFHRLYKKLNTELCSELSKITFANKD